SRRLRRNAAENARLALHDQLTGLPNRTLFQDRIEQAIRAGRRRGATVGLLLVDLDRFKDVNDTLGHRYGDALLKELSGRLSGIVRESDSLARLGGDEFGLLCPNAASEEALLQVVGRIAAELREPFVLDGLPIELEASIGIAVF